MVSVNQLSVFFGSFALFNGVSFIINPRDRIGLAGKNGAGKSTMIKLLAQEEKPTQGSVTYPRGFTIGHLPQHMKHVNDCTLMEETRKAFKFAIDAEARLEVLNEELTVRTDYESDDYMALIEEVTHINEHLGMMGVGNFEAEIEKTLLGLGFERNEFGRNTGEFSGGWRMRIELAKILLQKPDLILLDEPTNHLDIESIQWLENFLCTYTGAVVLVSHDRTFLDTVCNRTIEISLGKTYDYKASYTKYLELRKERREQQQRAFENQQKMLKSTEDFIDRFRYKASKSVQVQSRIKQLEKIDVIEIDEEDTSTLRLKFPPAPRSGSITIETQNYGKNYDEHCVLKNVNLIIERGEKVAFVGRNGEGKSTMVKSIMKEIEHEGSIKIGHNVMFGYFAQNQAQLLDENLSVFDTIDHVAKGEIRTQIRNILGAFMFGGEAVDKKVKVLSGGERSRLAMIRLLLEPVNLLVLDEPTNHLDLRSKDVLKEALLQYDGTVIVVSHDRDFLSGLVDKVYEFRDQKVREHLSGIDDFLTQKQLEAQALVDLKKGKTDKKAKEEEVVKVEKPLVSLNFEERKELNRNIKRIEKEITTIESRMEQKESEIKVMDEKASIGLEINYDIYNGYKHEIEKLLLQWESCTLELETLRAELGSS